jgi:YVTN family beta-propeller protein
LKDFGKTEVFDVPPPFSVLKTIDTGPITNYVNIVHNAKGTFAYVTVGDLNEVEVFRTDNFSKVTTGKLPHGTRIYVGDESGDRLVAIDTLTNKVIAISSIGSSQAIVYVPNAVPEDNGTQGLQPFGTAGNATHLSLVPPDHGKYNDTNAPTIVVRSRVGANASGSSHLTTAQSSLRARTPAIPMAVVRWSPHSSSS